MVSIAAPPVCVNLGFAPMQALFNRQPLALHKRLILVAKTLTLKRVGRAYPNSDNSSE